MSVQLEVLFLICSLPSIFCSVKTWVPTTSFYLSTNYEDNILPCSHQEVVFDRSLFPPVLLDSETSVKGFILPETGQIQFGGDGKVTFGESKNSEGSKTCSNEKYSIFRGQTKLFWLQSNSWKLKNENKAVPDAERIPCQYDQVIIPEKSTYLIYLPDEIQKVQSLKLGDLVVDQQSFYSRALVGGSENTQTFVLNHNGQTGVLIKPDGCTNKAGCVCQDETIDHMILCMGQVCPKLECQIPIKPQGHCCYICGAILSQKVPNNGFNFAEYKQNVEDVASNYGADKKIFIHVGRLQNNFVQVVAVESKKYDGSSGELMLKVSNSINVGSEKLLLISGPPKDKEWQGLLIAGLTLVVIAMIFVGLILWYHTSDLNINRPHILARFRHRALSRDSDISLQEDPSLQATFHNPLYSSQRGAKQRTQRRVSTSSMSSQFSRMSTLLTRSRDTQE